jgi:hypothetical protein
VACGHVLMWIEEQKQKKNQRQRSAVFRNKKASLFPFSKSNHPMP